MQPVITSVNVIPFNYYRENIGKMESGFNLIYEPDTEAKVTAFFIEIETNVGICGEYVSWVVGPPGYSQIEMVKRYLVGKNPLRREKHWSEIKRGLRKYDRMGLGPIDIALWDFAGKYYEASIAEMLGLYRTKLPTYASTYFGDDAGGLDSPEAFADFAEECYDIGYQAFKIHGWGGSPAGRDIDRLVDTIHAVGERVGTKMDIMLDPSNEYETWADALKMGRACDEFGYFWLEDPYKDGGYSMHGHRRLSDYIDTPLLMGEYVRSLENRTDFMASESTDFVRADPDYDGGITGAMKTAHAAEGLGLDVEFHPSGPAQRHCVAATRNTNYYENAVVHPIAPHPYPHEIHLDNYDERLDAIDENGCVPVPAGPGLGVEYDRDYIIDNQVSAEDFGDIH